MVASGPPEVGATRAFWSCTGPVESSSIGLHCFDRRTLLRVSWNDRLQTESNALVEPDARGWRAGRPGEVSRPGDAIGRFDQSQAPFAGDEEESGVRIRHGSL